MKANTISETSRVEVCITEKENKTGENKNEKEIEKQRKEPCDIC